MLKKLRFNHLILLVSILLSIEKTSAKSCLSVINLNCNQSTNTTGVLSDSVFGWQLSAKINDQSQTAFQILVSSSKQKSNQGIGDILNTKKVDSNNSINIPYEGKILRSSKTYYWRVRVWDKSGNISSWSNMAYFIAGLVNKNDIKGDWITSSNQKGKPMPLFRKSVFIEDS